MVKKRVLLEVGRHIGDIHMRSTSPAHGFGRRAAKELLSCSNFRGMCLLGILDCRDGILPRLAPWRENKGVLRSLERSTPMPTVLLGRSVSEHWRHPLLLNCCRRSSFYCIVHIRSTSEKCRACCLKEPR